MELLCDPITSPVTLTGRLSKQDLTHLEKFFRNKYGVRIAQTAAGLWAIEIKFDGEEQVYRLETSRGMLKVWRGLSSAIGFVQQHCPSAAEVLVDVYGWRLKRLVESAGPSIQ